MIDLAAALPSLRRAGFEKHSQALNVRDLGLEQPLAVAIASYWPRKHVELFHTLLPAHEVVRPEALAALRDVGGVPIARCSNGDCIVVRNDPSLVIGAVPFGPFVRAIEEGAALDRDEARWCASDLLQFLQELDRLAGEFAATQDYATWDGEIVPYDYWEISEPGG